MLNTLYHRHHHQSLCAIVSPGKTLPSIKGYRAQNWAKQSILCHKSYICQWQFPVACLFISEKPPKLLASPFLYIPLFFVPLWTGLTTPVTYCRAATPLPFLTFGWRAIMLRISMQCMQLIRDQVLSGAVRH